MTLLVVLDRITREKKAASRDPRMEILYRLNEFGDIRVAGELRSMLSDFDPAVANFVVQGGSPGGLSTRGRDTGDAQFYINLVDNFRLDHNYTVFAQITDGIESIDRIQEGDVIESIEILRQVQPQ